jgi:hypothetical protein
MFEQGFLAVLLQECISGAELVILLGASVKPDIRYNS